DEPAPFAEEAVEVDGALHGDEAVLAEHHHAHPAGFKEASEIPDDTVNVAEIADDFRDIWAEALQVVVEVGQVDEVQMRRVAFLKPLRGPRNPFTRGDA